MPQSHGIPSELPAEMTHAVRAFMTQLLARLSSLEVRLEASEKRVAELEKENGEQRRGTENPQGRNFSQTEFQYGGANRKSEPVFVFSTVETCRRLPCRTQTQILSRKGLIQARAMKKV